MKLKLQFIPFSWSMRFEAPTCTQPRMGVQAQAESLRTLGRHGVPLRHHPDTGPSSTSWVQPWSPGLRGGEPTIPSLRSESPLSAFVLPVTQTNDTERTIPTLPTWREGGVASRPAQLSTHPDLW